MTNEEHKIQIFDAKKEYEVMGVYNVCVCVCMCVCVCLYVCVCGCNDK